jgi:addiction module HigA family antidote
MDMERLPNIHPGEILEEEFLRPLGISAYRLAKETKIPQTRVSEIINRRRRITADTALRLSKFFNNSPEFWLGLQIDYDLEEERKSINEELRDIHHYSEISENAKP